MRPTPPLLLLSTLLAVGELAAQTPTWSEDVGCIINTHCSPCHFDGGPGHFSLTTWEDAYMWRNDIATLTAQRLMPPWPPDPGYRSLAHERVLTQEEIDIIAAWVQADAPEGDPELAPVPPEPPSGWAIADPDITAMMPEFVVPPSTSDLYRCFVLEVDNPVERQITELEVVPGNREVVHHVLVYQDTSGQARILDENDPGPGYTSFGGIGVPSAKLVGIWVPGAEPFRTAPGMGIPLLADADLVIQVHYPAGSDAQLDTTRVNLRLSSSPQLRALAIDPILDHWLTITDGPLLIPPGQVRSFHAQYTSPIPATITAIGPHAHLICTSMRSYAVLPGGDTLPLIDIPKWDFRWQDLYRFRQPIYLPAGTTLHGEATYDNTNDNPNNPSDPPQWVYLGEATTDEMMLFYFAWTFGLPSDAGIVVDTVPPGAAVAACLDGITGIRDPGPVPQQLELWPLPAADVLHVRITEAGELSLLDAAGRVAWRRRMEGGEHLLEVGTLGRGTYIAQWRNAAGDHVERHKLLLQ